MVLWSTDSKPLAAGEMRRASIRDLGVYCMEATSRLNTACGEMGSVSGIMGWVPVECAARKVYPTAEEVPTRTKILQQEPWRVGAMEGTCAIIIGLVT